MNEADLIRAYTTSIFMLSLLDEYGELERFGSFARVYNTLVKRNKVFREQIDAYNAKKKKKISEKAILFSMAVKVSLGAWDTTTDTGVVAPISAGTTIVSLFKRNEDLMKRVYGVKSDDFRDIGKKSQANVTLNSCKMARALCRNMENEIEKNINIKENNEK